MTSLFTARAAVPVPPSPWQLQGSALVIMGRLRRGAARELAGGVRGLVAPAPFGSLAALGLIRYDTSPVGPYHEMMVVPGLLWRDIPAAFISHLLVDSQPSWLGGRALWGLPKEMAHFDWQVDDDRQHFAVATNNDTPLLQADIRLRGRLSGLVVPPLPFMSARGPRRQLFTINGRVQQMRRASVTLTIPPTSPYSPLRHLLQGIHLALWLDSFSLRISNAFDLL
jgi:hypothetical protein